MLGDGKSLVPGVCGPGAGLLPRFLHELHAQLQETQRERRYHCEFYEVYNEQIQDLLAPPRPKGSMIENRKRTVHVHPKHGVMIEGLMPTVVSDAQQALDLIRFGNQMRSASATTMNERSSRSHAVFTFKFEFEQPKGNEFSTNPLRRTGSVSDMEEQRHRVHNQVLHCESTVTFVDLAGREEQAATFNQGGLFKEMIHINSSLFHLSNVITKLSEGTVQTGSLADFRNSKLTLILSRALIGNSRTTLIATLSPLASFFDETVATLTFASAAEKVSTRPVLNNKGQRYIVSELESEIQKLRRELSETQTNSGEKDRELTSAEAMVSLYRRSWEDAKELSQLDQQRRLEVAKLYGLSDAEASDKTPYLTNLSNDPSLKGIRNYYLSEDCTRIGSNEEVCSIVIKGIGILPVMCEVKCWPSGAIDIELVLSIEKDDSPVDDASVDLPRVLVNGANLVANVGRPLESHDTLIFGYAHAFRLVVPVDPTASSGTPSDSFDNEILRSAFTDFSSMILDIEQNASHFQAALPFLKDLSLRAPEDTVKSFVKSLQTICPLIDEANLITREIHRNSWLSFQSHVLTEMMDFEHDKPELVVCVLWDPLVVDRFLPTAGRWGKLRASGVAKQSSCRKARLLHEGGDRTPQCRKLSLEAHMSLPGCGKAVLYVWSLEKFLKCLVKIREVYEEGFVADDDFASVRRMLRDNPHLDPWRETSVREAAQLAMLRKSNPRRSALAVGSLEAATQSCPVKPVTVSAGKVNFDIFSAAGAVGCAGARARLFGAAPFSGDATKSFDLHAIYEPCSVNGEELSRVEQRFSHGSGGDSPRILQADEDIVAQSSHQESPRQEPSTRSESGSPRNSSRVWSLNGSIPRVKQRSNGALPISPEKGELSVEVRDSVVEEKSGASSSVAQELRCKIAQLRGLTESLSAERDELVVDCDTLAKKLMFERTCVAAQRRVVLLATERMLRDTSPWACRALSPVSAAAGFSSPQGRWQLSSPSPVLPRRQSVPSRQSAPASQGAAVQRLYSPPRQGVPSRQSSTTTQAFCPPVVHRQVASPTVVASPSIRARDIAPPAAMVSVPKSRTEGWTPSVFTTSSFAACLTRKRCDI